VRHRAGFRRRVHTSLSWAPLRWLVKPVSIPFLALVIVATVQRDLDGRGTMWRWRPLVLLGERSYAFYLVHQLIIRLWAKSAHDLKITSAVVGVVWFLLLLAIAVGVSSALFLWLEVPMEQRLRGVIFASARTRCRPFVRGDVAREGGFRRRRVVSPIESTRRMLSPGERACARPPSATAPGLG
jgi:peptidoglycan/LPS O-acetylase OafA/YrhL